VASDLLSRAAALLNQGRLGEAERVSRRLPRDADSSQIRGAIAGAGGDWGKALQHFRQAIRLEPECWGGCHSAGVALRQLGRNEEAVALLGRASRGQPEAMEFALDLGDALAEARRWKEALRAYGQAGRAGAVKAALLPRLARCWERLGQFERAAGAWREYLIDFPSEAAAWTSLGSLLAHSGNLREGVRALRKAVAVDPEYLPARSNLLLMLHYDSASGRLLASESKRHGAAFGIAGSVRPPGRELAGRRLRVGYVSGDFREHSVISFFEPVLRAHDRARTRVYCYSNVAVPDGATRRAERLADDWRAIAHLDDDEAARLVRKDRIDVLIDLSGHTNRHRLGLFARRAAPVQLSYIGYPDDPGLEAIDGYVTDRVCDPGPGRHLYLGPCFLAYAPPGDITVSRKEPRRRHITFGSFAVRRKLSPHLLELWAEILLRVQGSRLLLKGSGYEAGAVRGELREFFERRGVEARRIRFLGIVPRREEHLRLYREVDIALDTFPYAGTATTCEALWMGVPVVTLAGGHHASRVGLSLLTAVGLGELAAFTGRQYVKIASGLAGDVERLRGLRGELRGRMKRSALLDGGALTRQLEAELVKRYRACLA
jgi:protein O-GlcNAc transferase